MRQSRLLAIAILLLTGREALVGQYPSWTLMAGVRGSYTTSSKLFANPDAASASVRASYTAFEGLYAGGVEVRLKMPDAGHFLALSADYIFQRQERTQIVRSVLASISVPATEGIEAIPLELSGNIYVPLGTPAVRLLMGGGPALTVVRRRLTVGGVRASPVATPLSVGIHVRTAVEYRVRPGILLVGELRLRDPEAATTNRFDSATGEYRGMPFELPTSDVRGKVNVDGMNLSLGLMVEIL